MRYVVKQIANIRRSPGFTSKDAFDVVGATQVGDQIESADDPVTVDGLQWVLSGRGWVAISDPQGEIILAAVNGPQLANPVGGKFPVTQLYGENSQVYAALGFKGHTGIDWGLPVGSEIYAMDAGRVVRLDTDPPGYGLFVKIQHVWGESLYAHLSGARVAIGDQVAKGQCIALSGNSGWSTGPHLHAQVRLNPYNTGDGMNGCSDFLHFLTQKFSR